MDELTITKDRVRVLSEEYARARALMEKLADAVAAGDMHAVEEAAIDIHSYIYPPDLGVKAADSVKAKVVFGRK